jgi:acyl-coenzyme A synthetase/AMP-(fatty) acid ligase
MTMPHNNLARAFGAVAEANASLPALIAQDEVLSYADLWRLVRRIAARMQADGVGAQSLVAVNTQDMRASLGTVLATALLGAGFVVAGQLLAHAKVLKPTHFYRTPEMSGSTRVPFRVIDADWLGADDGAEPTFVAADPDANWLYLHTSGTTGTPKYLALSQRVVWKRSLASAADFPFRKTTYAGFFSSTSRPFYARAMAALLQACTLVEGMDLARWQSVGVNFVCGSPTQVLEALGEMVIDPPFDRLEVSGAPLPGGSAALYLRSFRRVLDVYGASETSKSFANEMSLDPDGGVLRTGVIFDSEVEIIDALGRPCPPGVAGTVRVRNAYLARGYVAAPEASAQAFRDGWFHPGDIARWGPRGDLIILGRDDSTLNIGGYKISADLVEFLARSVPGVADAVCFQNPVPGATQPVVCFLVFAPGADRDTATEELLRLAAVKLGHVFARKNLRAIDKIPSHPDGRHDRKACQALVMSYAHSGGEFE